VLTLPIVALEWITVLALDPDARNQRAESASKSELATVERETRERFRMSDPVLAVRNAAALTEVIHEELLHLPSEQRAMFIGILRGKHGAEFEGVPLLLPGQTDLPGVIDQPKDKKQKHEEPVQRITDRMRERLGLNKALAMATMTDESPIESEAAADFKRLYQNGQHIELANGGGVVVGEDAERVYYNPIGGGDTMYVEKPKAKKVRANGHGGPKA
jgi:hypothetical protein